MDDQQTQSQPEVNNSTPASAPFSGDNLGNFLIGGAIVMAFVLVLGFRFASTNGSDEDPDDRDAEIEFVQDRNRDAEVEFARVAFVEPVEPVRECVRGEDGDAESRFADDVPRERNGCGLFPNELDHQVDRELLDFDRFERPTLRADLADRNSSRVRELEISLGPGRSDVDLAIRNPDRLRQSNGIVVRSENDVRELTNTGFVTIERPNDCRDGCDFTVWITMARDFQDLHPNAEVLVFAGDDADAWIQELDELPRRAHG